jgi:hypothetical protein
MQSRVTFGFVLLCALASPISSARIRNRARAPDEDTKLQGDTDSNINCEDAISQRIELLMDRISVYYGQCGMNDDEHITKDSKSNKYVVTDEGTELLCKKSCRSHEDFAEEAPDSTDLIRECTGNEFLKTIEIHDTFDRARMRCQEEMLSPLVDYVDEDVDHVDDTGVEVEPELETIESPKTIPEIVDDEHDPNVVDVPIESPKTEPEPEIVDVPVESPKREPEIIDVPVESPKREPVVKPVVKPEIVELPVASPVAPLKGKKVKQQLFEYKLKGVLALRTQPSCPSLKEVFKVCDYKRTGKVFFRQIDDMLDKLDSEKQESLQVLRELYAKVNKDPETQPMTFKDWTFFKMGRKEAMNCALEYAMQG